MAARYTKFVIIRNRIERLKKKIKEAEQAEEMANAKLKPLQLFLRTQLVLLENQLKETYHVIDLMESERMKQITELRYIDGLEWKEIKDYTGLSLPRLYQINMDINSFFTMLEKDYLLYSEKYTLEP